MVVNFTIMAISMAQCKRLSNSAAVRSFLGVEAWKCRQIIYSLFTPSTYCYYHYYYYNYATHQY